MLAILRDDDSGEEIAEVKFCRPGYSPKRTDEDHKWATGICDNIGELVLNTKSLLVAGTNEKGEMFITCHVNEKAEKFSKKFRSNKDLDRAACLAEASSLIYSVTNYIANKYDEDLDSLFDKIIKATKIVHNIKDDFDLSDRINEIEKLSDSRDRAKAIQKLLIDAGVVDKEDLDAMF